MGASYHTSTTAWPTFANGKSLSDAADLAVIFARADALDRDICEEIARDVHGCDSLVDYGTMFLEDNPPKAGSGPEQRLADEDVERHAVAEIRRQVKAAMTELFDNANWLDHSFDGVRWVAATGGMSNGDSPSDEFDWVALVGQSAICEAPLDASEFTDTAAIAAAIAVLDDMAATTLAALVAAGLPTEVTDVAAAALEDARNAILPTSRLIRRAMTQLTAQRTTEAFKL